MRKDSKPTPKCLGLSNWVKDGMATALGSGIGGCVSSSRVASLVPLEPVTGSVLLGS